MSDQPRIETRSETPYVGERTTMALSDFERRIPQLIDSVSARLRDHGLRPAGPPFLRYYIIDMPDRLDVELGFPLSQAPDDGRLEVEQLPAGRYALLTYTGARNGVAANTRLIAWTESRGEKIASRDTGAGEAFDARYETFLTDPGSEGDPDKLQTEAAMLLRD